MAEDRQRNLDLARWLLGEIVAAAEEGGRIKHPHITHTETPSLIGRLVYVQERPDHLAVQDQGQTAAMGGKSKRNQSRMIDSNMTWPLLHSV